MSVLCLRIKKHTVEIWMVPNMKIKPFVRTGSRVNVPGVLVLKNAALER